jgi:outer membrane scaffolding protein for murein synthesis (MipA/OmpV family)
LVNVFLNLHESWRWVAIILLSLALPKFCFAAAGNDNETTDGRFQFGLGLGGQAIPDYRGSNQSHVKVIPFPLILYTGRYLKINREGARGELFDNNRVQVNLSVDAALSGDDDDNRAREGMPGLDSAFEFGPSVNVRLSGPNFNDGWAFRFPVRLVTALGSDGIQQLGYVVNPRLVWRKPNYVGEWALGLSLGALWGSEKYHAYYYSVAPQFVTATRPEYEAKGGYAGAFTKLTLARKWQDGWLMGVSFRYDNLSGAAFAESPLVLTQHYGSISFGVGKVFWAR